jgi:hypothetical protein
MTRRDVLAFVELQMMCAVPAYSLLRLVQRVGPSVDSTEQSYLPRIAVALFVGGLATCVERAANLELVSSVRRAFVMSAVAVCAAQIAFCP